MLATNRPTSNRSSSSGLTGTSSQIALGNGTPADHLPDGVLRATDIPTGVDATKLADGSVTNTELQYINTLSSNAQTQITATITVANAALPKAGYPSGSAAMTGALAFTGTQSSAGASIVSDYRDSSGNKIANVATGAYHGLHVNNTLSTYFTATAAVCPALRFSAGSGTFAMLSQVSNTQTAICGDSSAGTIKPEVCVSGNSHTSYPGCVEIKAGAIAQASNGTWTSKYSLAKGTHNGRFIVYDTANAGIAAVYNVIGTTLTLATGGAAEYVISGSESTTTIAGRISSANFQINVGTSISTRSFAVIFEGTVT